jgi:hypothetical protein
MTCDARIRPFPGGEIGSTEIACELDDDGHFTHCGVLRDYAYTGSTTELKWMDDDRRNYRGAWPGPCRLVDGTLDCVLPAGHRGNHAP